MESRNNARGNQVVGEDLPQKVTTSAYTGSGLVTPCTWGKMNARQLWFVLLLAMPLLIVCPANAAEPKPAQADGAAKPRLKKEVPKAASPQIPEARVETSSKKQSVPAARSQVVQPQVRQAPAERPARVQFGEKAANPRPRVASAPPPPKPRSVPRNPFEQPIGANPTAATIGQWMPTNYRSPGAEPLEPEKPRFTPIPTYGYAPRAPTAPLAPKAPRAPTARG